MNEIKWTVIFVCIVITASCLHVKDKFPPLQVISHVDLNRYLGTWYEIARYPHKFQKGCIGSRATYTLRDDGKLSVLNECYEESDKSRIRSAGD